MKKNLCKVSLLIGLFLMFMGTAKSQNGEMIITTPDLSIWTCEVGEVQTFIWKYNYTLDGYDKECDDINPASIELSIGTTNSDGESTVEIVGGPSVEGCFVSVNFICHTDDPLDLNICVNALAAFQASDDGKACFDLMETINSGHEEEPEEEEPEVEEPEEEDPDSPECMVNAPCDDGDSCTTDDRYDSNCNCVGQEVDSDGDGVADCDDCAPDDSSISSRFDACDDGDPCTVNDQIDSNCNCRGQEQDSDGDGVADCDDCAPNDPNASGRFDACDDGDPTTVNDQYDSNCNCRGEVQDSDGDGVIDSEDCAPNDPNASSRFDPCDDGNANTSNDQYDSNCNCRGQEQDSDGDGVVDSRDCAPDDPNASSRFDPCDDGDPVTENDQYDSNCNCRGVFVDRGDDDGDGVLNFEDCAPNDPNASSRFDACDDGDPETVNDQYDSNCNCRGRAPDSDGDGVSDSEDCAPNDPNASSRFDACDDGDPNTVNDQYDSFCRCRGQVSNPDSDNDGVPDDEDCAPNDPDASSRFDACDDGDPNTENDQYDSNCNCRGEEIVDDPDCNIGSPCDDGDDNTINDKYDSNCNCVGEEEEIIMGPSTSVVLFDLDACVSRLGSGGNDYSEFVASYPNTLSCATFTSSHLHRANPNLNKHSCTPGAGGSPAMCVSARIECDYSKTSDQALVFEVQVGATGPVSITGLNFLEKAPEQYEWIDGASGTNNYPTLYGVRVLVDGNEVFYQDGISTTTEWTEESFSFDDVIIQADATVRVEMLSYCPIGNDGRVAVWDVENIELIAACGPSAGSALVSGLVSTMDNQPLSDVLLTLEGDGFQQEYMTSASGSFDFGDVPMSSHYLLSATKKTEYLRGVSTLDLVIMQNHILGLDPFEDAFRYIAADINKDDRVTAVDMIELRKLILGKYDALPNNDSYRFYDQNETIEMQNPYMAQEELYLESIEDFGTTQNITGIKIGDVNIAQAEKRSNNVSLLNYQLRTDNKTGKQMLDFYFEEDEQFEALQLNLLLRNSALGDLRSGQLELISSDYNIIGEKELRISQNFEEVASFDADLPLFSIEVDFTGTLDQMILIQDIVLKSELYNSKGDVSSIEFVASDKNAFPSSQPAVFPNPFGNELNVSFELEVDQEVMIEIFDLNGRKLLDYTQTHTAGKNVVKLNAIPSLNSSSLLISRVSIGSEVYTNKIMQVQE